MNREYVVAPGAADFRQAGGIKVTDGRAACDLCGEWTDDASPGWARQHAAEVHDALRPSVLGLDLSLTRAGIAVSTRDPKTADCWPSVLTHVGMKGWEGMTWDQRCDRLVTQVTAVMGIVDAARRGGADFRLAVIEGPSYGSALLPSYYDRAGLYWPVYAAIRKRRIPIAVVVPDHRAKFICGVKPPSGDEGKKLVLAESRARWSSSRTEHVVEDAARLIANHDQADALGLCEMGVIGAKWKVPWQLRRRHVENVALVEWPKAA